MPVVHWAWSHLDCGGWIFYAEKKGSTFTIKEKKRLLLNFLYFCRSIFASITSIPSSKSSTTSAQRPSCRRWAWTLWKIRIRYCQLLVWAWVVVQWKSTFLFIKMNRVRILSSARLFSLSIYSRMQYHNRSLTLMQHYWFYLKNWCLAVLLGTKEA